MLEVMNIETWGMEQAIRSMRNPMNSWERSDSYYGCLDEKCKYCSIHENICIDYEKNYIVGKNDLELMRKLYKGGSEHRKYLRSIIISLDINAPLYWWKEFDTYKVGTVSNSCSTMHKIHAKEFCLDDFSHDHLLEPCVEHLKETIEILNQLRDCYINYEEYMNDYLMEHPNGTFPGKKIVWWQMIQLLPSSYNQFRTVTMNYETAVNIIHQRRNHKLDEWRKLCDFLLCECPYLRAIMGE